MTHLLRARPALGLALATALLALSGCGSGDGADGKAGEAGESGATSSEEPTSTATSTPPPGLEGVPEVVAEVNGEEVTRDEFAPFYEVRLQQAAEQGQATGQLPDEEALKRETLDEVVDTELLVQEASARGITVSDEDVDAELETLAKDYQLASGDELLAKLGEQGTTEDEVRRQVLTQVTVERLVEDEAGSLAPTEEELRALYAKGKQAAQQGGQQVPPYAAVKPQLEKQAAAEQVAEVAQTLVEGLREDAEITITLD